MNKEKRLKRANAARKLYNTLRCPKCNEIASHYAPPSFGEEGFYICEVKKNNSSGAKTENKQ